MSAVANNAFASKMITVTNTVSIGLADMGFTDTQIRGADAVHIQHISLQPSSPDLYFWYTSEAGIAKIPKSTLTGSGTPEGHVMFPGSDRIVRGFNNIKALRLIANTSSVKIAVTLTSMGTLPNI